MIPDNFGGCFSFCRANLHKQSLPMSSCLGDITLRSEKMESINLAIKGLVNSARSACWERGSLNYLTSSTF